PKANVIAPHCCGLILLCKLSYPFDNHFTCDFTESKMSKVRINMVLDTVESLLSTIGAVIYAALNPHFGEISEQDTRLLFCLFLVRFAGSKEQLVACSIRVGIDVVCLLVDKIASLPSSILALLYRSGTAWTRHSIISLTIV